jgi:hypothetical protein
MTVPGEFQRPVLAALRQLPTLIGDFRFAHESSRWLNLRYNFRR